MPKSKVNISDKTASLRTVGNLKYYTTDSIYDYAIIYKELMFYLENSITVSTYNRLDTQRKTFKVTKNYLFEHEYRVYILAAIDKTMFFLVDVEEFVINNLIEHFSDNSPTNDDLIETAFYLFPRMFIFKDSKLLFSSLLFPHQHAELMAVFAKENLVEFLGARRSYRSKPRT